MPFIWKFSALVCLAWIDQMRRWFRFCKKKKTDAMHNREFWREIVACGMSSNQIKYQTIFRFILLTTNAFHTNSQFHFICLQPTRRMHVHVYITSNMFWNHFYLPAYQVVRYVCGKCCLLFLFSFQMENHKIISLQMSSSFKILRFRFADASLEFMNGKILLWILRLLHIHNSFSGTFQNPQLDWILCECNSVHHAYCNTA